MDESPMRPRSLIRLAAIVIAVALLVAAVQAWRADQRDRAQLAAELAATKQLLAAADARQHDRDKQLAQTLSALAAEKRTIVTPAQIVRNLANEIPLPAPISLQADHTSSQDTSVASANATNAPATKIAGASSANDAQASTPVHSASQPNQKAAAGGAIVPAEDLKPLYDFVLDCQACQAKLSAAQGDLNDEKAKTAALTLERDQAVQIARGGSAWRRVGRAAKWFLIGAAAGAVAAKAAH
jgi:type II secretory pathway pseudopilin PulG